MKAQTVKRLAILIAVLSLAGGTGFYAQQVRVRRTADGELKKADHAVKNGDFAKAEEIYRLYLEVFTDDVDILVNYADVLLKVDDSPNRQEEVIQIYRGILTRTPGRDDVRRLLMQLKFDTKHLISRGGQDEGADSDLKILLGRKEFEQDGSLWFLLGQCQEEGDNAKDAEKSYQKAIDFHAPQQIEAYERRASLFRDRLDRPEEADRLIKAMVDAYPDNYQVYLERGRYRLSLATKMKDPSLSQSLLTDAKKDFDEARKRASDKPEIYLEMAKLATNELHYNEAAQLLEEGLQNAPSSKALYHELASTYWRDRKTDKATEILKRGLRSLKSATGQAELRLFLAHLLALSGDTSELKSQIDQLEEAGIAPIQVQYLRACYSINAKDFVEARRLLTLIQPTVNRSSNLELKVRINLLLAQCYGHLGDPEKQRDANLRAYSANPQNPAARQDWIAYLVNQGKVDEAINECRAAVDQAPEVRLILARLLIARNRQRPKSQRDWSEIEHLIDASAKAAPESIEPVVLRVKCLSEQGNLTLARQELEKAQQRFPKRVELWIAQADLLASQQQLDEALRLLDQAKGQLGDQVNLRLARAELLAMKRGPQVVKAVSDLAENSDAFSREDRHKLLNALGNALIRKGDLEGANRLWSQLADEEPKNMELRLNLLELAFQTAHKDEIEKNIRQIEEIEGSNGLMSRYCQANYLIWQASKREDRSTRETLRTKAHAILDELKSRRGDWSPIPIALAQLEEQELDQDNLKVEEKQAKEGHIIGFYLQAIKLGNRTSAVLRRALQLLLKNNRRHEAIDLLNSIPLESQLASGLGNLMEGYALKNRDFEGVEQMARKAIQAHPGEFSEQIWLVRILLAQGRQAEAEAELRRAVEVSGTDPVRWVTLVRFLVVTKQAEKAEKAVRDTQANLTDSEKPLAMARCCEIMGSASTDEAATKWYGEAKDWYRKAERAHPDDVSIKRRLTEFFFQTRQVAEAKAELNAILKQGEDAWAKRTLATILASGTDSERAEALSYFEPNNQPAPVGQEGKACEDPADLRVLARVLEAQKTTLQRKRAIEILESLGERNLFTADDLFLLAQLQEQSGDWPKARERYRELNLRTKVLPDLESVNLRSHYLFAFADGLLRHRQCDDEQDLAEVQEIVAEIKRLQPNALGTVQVEARLFQARNELDKAAKVIQAFADRPDRTPQVLEILAHEAEKLGQAELAEQLYTRRAAIADVVKGTLELAAFLGRHGHAKKALDVLEPLWANPRDIRAAREVAVGVLISANGTRNADLAEFDRVAGWLERALAQPQNQRSTALLVDLGLIREHQGKSQDAAILFHRAIQGDDALLGKIRFASFLGRRGEAKNALDTLEPLWANASNVPAAAAASIDVLFGVNSTNTPEIVELHRVAGWFEQALAQRQKHREMTSLLLVGLGNIREQEGRYQDAEALYQRAIEQGDSGGVSYNNLAWLTALKDNKPVVALDYINRAMALRPDYAEFLDTRGIIYLKAERIPCAIDDLTKAATIDRAPAKLFHLALAYFAAKDKEKSRQNLDAARLRGLTLSGLHPLERPAYEKILKELVTR